MQFHNPIHNYHDTKLTYSIHLNTLTRKVLSFEKDKLDCSVFNPSFNWHLQNTLTAVQDRGMASVVCGHTPSKSACLCLI